jgi:hypothetical protein
MGDDPADFQRVELSDRPMPEAPPDVVTLGAKAIQRPTA